jgi:hypothetical protein
MFADIDGHTFGRKEDWGLGRQTPDLKQRCRGVWSKHARPPVRKADFFNRRLVEGVELTSNILQCAS